MRKDREENLDYLDEEDTGIEDERQGFSGSPKNVLPVRGPLSG
jgi:type IV secretion system protein VirB10